MTEIKAIIADDEKQLRIYLKRQLSEVWPELRICGESQDGQQALALIQEKQPDIAFLDIKMPGLNGMQVARKIAHISRVVFITAYDQYAIEAFENEAVDYLLKPVSSTRLKETVRRLKERIVASPAPSKDLSQVIERLMAGLEKMDIPGYLNWIRVQVGEEIRLISVEEVCYFKASDKYTIVMTRNGEFLIRKTIKALEKELDPNRFWRIHRGTIVNAACIAKVSRSVTGRGIVKLKDLGETLTVSKRYIHRFRQM